MYNPSSPTCVSDHASFSACTARRSLPAISVSSHFPHVLPADPYLRFRFPIAFLTYNSSSPTCAFSPFSAFHMYNSPILTCVSDHTRFPHVQLADPYLRFRFPIAFRTYNSSISTCVSAPAAFSACTTRQSLPASPLPPRFPHVQPVDPYLRL